MKSYKKIVLTVLFSLSFCSTIALMAQGPLTPTQCERKGNWMDPKSTPKVCNCSNDSGTDCKCLVPCNAME